MLRFGLCRAAGWPQQHVRGRACDSGSPQQQRLPGTFLLCSLPQKRQARLRRFPDTAIFRRPAFTCR
ncbi:MAG TPA: hypothetical protein VFB21_23300 [Chthonomonadaceae bacterium]|nr:hypothetical protein [Chthonomonadaceae bacterium]